MKVAAAVAWGSGGAEEMEVVAAVAVAWVAP
jgi:hypothetical protein